MPWQTPRTPRRFADELLRSSKALRVRATILLQEGKPFDFRSEVTPFITDLRFRAQKLEKASKCGYSTREDMRRARLFALSALLAAAGLLEARLFEDFEGSTDRNGAAEVLRAAAKLLEGRVKRDFKDFPDGAMWYPEGRPDLRS